MQATADSLAFAPPPEPAAIRGFVLAVIAHLLLLIALSGLITWQSDDRNAVVEAELWSSLPQEAAPPPPPPQPEVQQPAVQPAPPPPVTKQPDIAIEREKKKREEEAKRREEEELRRKQLEAQKQQRLAEEKKQKDELAKKDKQKKELEAKMREQLRKEQIARAQALAGAGRPDSQGNAPKSAALNSDYAGRIAALIRRNTKFTEELPNNPSVEVEVRLAPDGTIVGEPKVVKSSGNAARDEAVVRGIIRTERIPRGPDGRVPSSMILEVRQFN
jgi:colicin import membrane protein